MSEELKAIISGGGTGGHIFPAISIANAIKGLVPTAKILFVGAVGRMEMEKVPMAGYEITGLPARGLLRPLYSPRNIGVIADYMKSKHIVKRTIRDFNPHIAIGVGGYASAATISVAHSMGIPCLIQEQNSYAGVTNKMLAGAADRICVAWDGMERFFPAEKILKTGNPVRQGLGAVAKRRACGGVDDKYVGRKKKRVVIMGGSLGAKTINESVMNSLNIIAAEKDIDFLWQTGKTYYAKIKERLDMEGKPDNLTVTEFINDMPDAYMNADLVVSRAGASSISELCMVAMPAILVPSPNVAEDHQTKNAMALADKHAALHVRDCDARDSLIMTAVKTVKDNALLTELSVNISRMAMPDAADIIAQEAIRLAERRRTIDK